MRKIILACCCYTRAKQITSPQRYVLRPAMMIAEEVEA